MDIKKTACLAILAAGLWAGGISDGVYASKLNLGYLYFGTPEAFVRQVEASGQALNRVSPTLFDLTPEGGLKLTSDISVLVQAMKDKGVKVVPFLSNHWDRETGRRALANREALASSIAEAVLRYRLDGVNVDLENLTEQDRDAYTDLVRLLRQKLPAGTELSVAIAANPAGWTKGWQASYDLPGLAAASDYLMLMAYDEHWEGDPVPGPVASLAWVEKSVQAALRAVPAEKLVLGIPFYGRFWKEGGGITGAGIPNKTAEALAARFGVTPSYDAAVQAAVFTMTVAPEETNPPVVNSRKLEPGTYTVWYDNERSIKAKLDLVGKYGLKGTGIWALSQETPATWSYYASWLNGIYFSDAAGHWAESGIRTVSQKGWMNGTGGASFGPEEPLTRAQAAAILTRILKLSASAAGQSAAVFADVPSSHWAKTEIGLAQRYGLVGGNGDGTFAPDRPVSREELAAMLYRAMGGASAPGGWTPGGVGTAPAGFNDVLPSRWSWSAVAALKGADLLQGYADGSFRPVAAVTRAEAAVLFLRGEARLGAQALVQAAAAPASAGAP
ncbi:S-layer homology domain-containing protein [Gorillibacterium sp. sgz5001074]|uniref:S-layer homology domain-containing protein n=1 Tax=Gorillibacterium sp. sgz5001074 TaxID=3446695 RepID=UPI003F66B26F